MTRLQSIGRDNWEAFVASPTAVLMLGKSDCAHCAEWTEELHELLADEGAWSDVQFGKLLLDTPGMGAFKKVSPWLADVDVLPFTVIYQGGEAVKSFAGKGRDRLENRLRRLAEDA